MNNPLMGMMGAMGGMRNGVGGNMMGRIRQFAGMIGSRDPKQMALAYMKQNGIPYQSFHF